MRRIHAHAWRQRPNQREPVGPRVQKIGAVRLAQKSGQLRRHPERNPDLRVVFSELTMAGTRETDVTEKFRSLLTDHGYGAGS